MLENELDSLKVNSRSTRNFILQQVGLKILNLLLLAVKQRENVNPIALSDLEMSRNEERIKKEVKKKALKELRIFHKRNHDKLHGRERYLAGDFQHEIPEVASVD